MAILGTWHALIQGPLKARNPPDNRPPSPRDSLPPDCRPESERPGALLFDPTRTLSPFR